MTTFLRLLRLWRLYAWLDFIWIMRSFRMFLLSYVGFAIVGMASIVGMLLLAERFDGVGVWSKWQIVFLLGYGSLVVGLLEMFFGFNVLHIGRRLGRGQFDHTLIQPQSVAMTLLSEGVNPFGSSNSALVGVVLIAWGWGPLALAPSPIWWALLVVNLCASSAVMLAYNIFWGSLAFWAPRAAEEINTPLKRMFDHLTIFPLDGLGGAMLGGLLTFVPVGFVAWYPCRYLLGLDAAPLAGFATPIAAVVVGALAAGMFRRGMRHYMRVGSQRYRAMGHRS